MRKILESGCSLKLREDINMLKKITILMILLVALVSCSKKQEEAKKPLKGVFSFVQGDVSLSKDAQKWDKAKLQDAIFENDWVKTSFKSFAKITMWKTTSFTIYPKSKVQIKELVKGKFDMTVQEGKVHCTVQKIAQGGHYRVKGPALLAGVRGTEFTFISDGNKDILVVKKGSVAVKRNIENAPIILLKPGERIEVSVNENKKLKKQAEGKTKEEQKKILEIKDKKPAVDEKHDDETEEMIKKHEADVKKKSSEQDKFVKKKSKEIDKFTKKKSEELQKSVKGSDDIGKDAQNSLKRHKDSKKGKKKSKVNDLRGRIKF